MTPQQKEFSFPVASSSSTRVARPTRVVPLGQTLEAKNGRSSATVGTSNLSVSSSSREGSSVTKKYSMQPSASVSNNVTMNRSQRGSTTTMQMTGSFHASSKHRPSKVTEVPTDDDDGDSFGGEADGGHDEWWGTERSSDQFAPAAPSSSAGRKVVRKIKVKAADVASGKPILDPHGNIITPKRLEQAVNRYRSSDDEGAQDKARRQRTKTPLRSVGGSKGNSNLLGEDTTTTTTTADAAANDTNAYTSPTKARPSRGRTETVKPSPYGRSRSLARRSSTAAPASPAVNTSPSGRVRQGRVARPTAPVPSINNNEETAVQRRPRRSHSVGHGLVSSRNSWDAAKVDSFDPFAVSDHEKKSNGTSNSKSSNVSDLPLLVQRRGKYFDQEAMLRKCTQLGITESILRDMKQAGLIITEGKV